MISIRNYDGQGSRRDFLKILFPVGLFVLAPRAKAFSKAGNGIGGDGEIGYTEYRTNLPTRHANQVTMRACVVHADGTGFRRLAEDLVQEPNNWTQFAGWSPDGKQAIIGRGWESFPG